METVIFYGAPRHILGVVLEQSISTSSPWSPKSASRSLPPIAEPSRSYLRSCLRPASARHRVG
eukprot:6181213-Pleurochrysis_carterae.AAC.1